MTDRTDSGEEEDRIEEGSQVQTTRSPPSRDTKTRRQQRDVKMDLGKDGSNQRTNTLRDVDNALQLR